MRLQTNEVLKPYAIDILKTVMSLLKVENEENGVICMKILTGLHRSYKAMLFEQVQPFLDLVVEIYKNIPQVVNDLFNQTNTSTNATPVTNFQSPKPLSPLTGGDGEPSARPLQKSMFSFKVLTECPIIIVLLYSTHKQLVTTSLPVFIPHIINMLSLQAAPQAKAHAAAAAKGELYTSISSLIKNRTAYGEFVVAQVKTMSFLAYALRGFSAALKKYHNVIPEFVVRLLQDCPCELSAARKELLVATRHILSTDFRTIFIPKVDILLNEKVLIGDGLTVHETLRPLAYSTMADLVHHVRGELTSEQIWKVVHVYCRNMQGDNLASSFQIMSAKLLLNLVERIMKLPDRAEGRQIMVMILNAFVERFAALNCSFPHIMEKHKTALKLAKKTSGDHEEKTEEEDVDKMEIDSTKETLQDDSEQTATILGDKIDLDIYDVEGYDIIKIHSDSSSQELKDARYIFKNLMNFLKTVMFGLKSCNPSPPHHDFTAQQWQESARMFNYEQITIFRQLFREGIAGHQFFSAVNEDTADDAKSSIDLNTSNMSITSSKDEKELMEAFATVFIHIDPACFNEIVGAELPYLYEQMFKNIVLLHIPQFFLASEATSSNFSSMLIMFLKDKLPELGEGDALKSHILIRLFKLCFMAVNLFPATNEAVLLPHLQDLIVKSMELAATAQDPIMYFHLLRTLFRSIGGGKFELLYKEVLPLLQVLLESLNKLLATARKTQERDIDVELCLTVPVRLSVLVPHLSFLMRPLVLALNGSQELVSQGLRTLELCVDNLTADYFDPIIEPVIDEVMEALWKHLKPLPYYHQHSHTTLRVLGKLGGRNRRFIRPPTNLKSTSVLDQDVSIMVNFRGLNGSRPVRITPGVKTAIETLQDAKATAHYKESSFKFLRTVLSFFIDSTPAPENFMANIKSSVDVIVAPDYPEVDKPLPDSGSKDFALRKLQNDLVEKILESIYDCVSVPELKDEAMEIIQNVCEHFVVLELGEFLVEKRKTFRPFELAENEGVPHIDPKTLLNVIMYALSHYNEEVTRAGQQSIKFIYQVGSDLFRSSNDVHRFPLFRSLFGKLSHTCFEMEYYRKAGACLGMNTILRDMQLPLSWIANRQLEFIRTMFFVLKDVPDNVPCKVRKEASELSFYVLRECNKDLTPEQMAEKPFKQLTGFLAYELGNSNNVVRQTSMQAIQVLSEVSGKLMSDLLRPVKDILLSPIFGKPLRALPFPMQIGHIDAIAFCLGLENTFLDFNDELTRLLLEALALVDAEDESLTSSHKVLEYSTSEQLVSLRIVCIKLLSLALTTSDYLAQQQPQTRAKIIAVFFKTLYSRSHKVVDAAHQGLKAVLAQNAKLPKDLLQNGLRPILMNLSDHKRLTVSGLEGLARLLELLTYYFKVEIGRKLLDHLKAWAEPVQLHSNSGKTLSDQNNIKIIVGILNIFHLLPPTAHVFMNDLVHTCFYLENHLRRQQESPFREPLAKFFERYPKETLEYFAPKLPERSYGRFFVSILANKNCVAFRKLCRDKIDDIKQNLSQPELSAEAKAVGICNLIYLVKSASLDDKDWLYAQKSLFEELSNNIGEVVSTAQKGSFVSPLYLQVEQSIQELQELFVTYFKGSTHDTDLLINLINSLFAADVRVNNSVANYIFNDIVSSTDYELRRTFLFKNLDVATNKANCSSARTFAVKSVINPILIVEGHRHGNLNALLTKCSGTGKGNSWLDAVHAKIWKPGPAEVAEENVGTIDQYRFQTLQMSALLLKLSPNLVADARKDVIKFAWNYIKLEDVVSKQAAYVLISYFIVAYDTLSKIVVQIYVALLKAHQNETKKLVGQALDLLAPVLVKRIGSPLWAKWPRRVISEDGYNVGQVVNIFQFIVHHPVLFYDYRDHFVNHIVAAMPKLCFLSNTSSEYQVLAIDLAELIVKWEQMTREKEAAHAAIEATEGADGEDAVMQDQGAIDESIYSVPLAQRESCIMFLIRFICVSSQKAAEYPLGKRSLKVLDKLLSDETWSEVVIKLNFFERSLVSNELNSPNAFAVCLNSLEVLYVIFRRRPANWIVDKIAQIERLLEKSIKSDNTEIHQVLERLLPVIYQAIHKVTENELGDDSKPSVEEDEIPMDVQTFLNFITTTIQDHFSSNYLASSTMLCCALAKFKPSAADPMLPLLLKAFGKLCKDHIGYCLNGTTGDSDTNSSPTNSEAENKKNVVLLEKILDLCASRISYLADQRRIFLSLFAQLIERSTDKGLCLKLIHITKNWAFSKTDLFPTVKEKAAILSKMMTFESRHDAILLKKYYEIVVAIYSDEALLRSELAVRMDHAFLVGTALDDVEIRSRLMKILSDSLNSNVLKRLHYVINEQNWEYLGDQQWLNQALQLLYGGADFDVPVSLRDKDFKTSSFTDLFEALPSSIREKRDVEISDSMKVVLEKREGFLAKLAEYQDLGSFFSQLIELQYVNPYLVHDMWINVFPKIYTSIPLRERAEMMRGMIALLSKEYLNRQIDKRPNVVQTIVEAAGYCEQLPPHLVKYLGKSFNAWYSAINVMENIETKPHSDSVKISESNQDALAEMYAGLQENDMFYGLWRRRAKYTETNSGLSYEQCGIWSRAMQMYESAQIKARSGVLPYSESEYSLWEDHWILCAEKLQQWDVLTELAKHEGFTDLLLECGWRVADWTADKDPLEQSIKTVMDVPTPRRQVFETFLSLQGYAQKTQTIQELSKYCDEGIQLTLHKWYGLPERVTGAHIPLLHTFQQYVEFMEASQVYTSLASTTAQNLDSKSQELKGVLQAWRERLPNLWDDINIWGDLVTWRQHAFGVINKVYLPLIPAITQANGNNNSTNSYAYRGYHEIAWIINRFAHVARKHNMPEVCISQLTKIYTLPNIEIQEAFLKLREQAKCHYQNPNELNTGLDVISNTNLVYFGAQQKAEFFTLKGMFLAKLNILDDANQAFATAVQIDLYLPKAWAEWGYYNDKRFKENPDELIYASNAISCYLQAAGLYKNGKTRKLLGRILWLISLDDANGSIAQAFDSYRGEVPVWYWITFIPQLLTSLSHKEARLVRHVLIKIAKSYPQALHFHLRTTREDYAVIQRQAMQAAQNAAKNQPSGQQAGSSNSAADTASPNSQNLAMRLPNSPAPGAAGSTPGANGSAPAVNKQPWEYVEEIMGILKTAYPLLALSLETLVDQIYHRFKSPVDEDAYRLIVALLNDGVQYMGRLVYPKEDAKLPPATETNISRFAESVLPKHIKAAFEADFVVSKPNLETYIVKLRRWRDRFEAKLDARPGKVNLEALSPHLSEFHYQKFEEIEVPGQYFEHKDSNAHFVKIDRFMPVVDIVRGFGICYRRITILGHDGSLHTFAVQYPAARHCRREERVAQLFKILNGVISRRTESRRRNLQFTLPIAVPLTPHIRIVQDDPRYVSMQHIYEDFCRNKGQSRDEPLNYSTKKLRAAFDPKLPKPDIAAIKMEILSSIQASIVPTTVFRDYFMKSYSSFADFWLFRKQFSYQYAGITFMTFLMSINNRYPHKFLINLASGNVWATEMLPILPPSKSAPAFHNGESVPFRLTPNIQTLMGPTCLEGLYAMSIMIIARGLTEPEFDLDQYLCVFVRDELISWYTQQHRPSVQDQQLRDIVKVNVEAIVKRASSLAQMGQGNIPANQTVIDLISQAVNPRHLALTDNLWMPYL